ncbi:Nn.00g115070.m01.CDS01 [Neocucurbitaria sp. VM-36]
MDTPSALTNVSSYLPSPADLLMVFPRLFSKASSLGDMIRSGGSVIAEPTLVNVTNSTITSTAGQFVQESVATAASAAASQDEIGMFQAFKNIASFFSYMTSKWAIATFAIAILLNRTHFYASSRVPLSFDRLYLRLALYITPLLLFLFQIQSVLQAIRCQTSPGWSEMQYGAPDRQLDTDFGGEGGYVWRAASTLLFWETTEESCRAVNMIPVDTESTRAAGSLALLWPLFLSLGFGQFVETLSCALQGRHPIHEAGLTIFEHSLAFAEAEAVVTKPLAVDSIRFFKPQSVFTPDGTSFLIPRSRLSKIANVPPEVLLISLISSISHFTSNTLAIAGVRSRYRLITTAIWGLAYMSTFAWSFSRLTSMITEPDQYVVILRFPTVCIVGFIPHLLILLGIAACGFIYLLALLITVLSPPPGQAESMTLRERFAVAYGNLHANIHLSAITPLTINWNDDFYAAILKVGFTVLTAASEAVFLNEGTKVNVHSMTWLEKQRLQDILTRRRQFRQSLTNIPSELKTDALAAGIEIVDNVNGSVADQAAASGYANERKARSPNSASDATRSMGRNDPAGLQQRRSRFFLTYQFFKSISKLIGLIHARLTIALLRKLRITYRPRWLRRLAGPPPTEKGRALQTGLERSQYRSSAAGEPWLTLDDRTRIRPDSHFDVESFARERLRQSGFYANLDAKESEDRLNDYLYSWWRNGGRWGDIDTSSDYIPSHDDDDTTSVVSFATTTDNEGWSDVDDGQRTPTRDTYQRSREATPLAEDAIDFSRLSQLLDPKTQDDREEAKLLARHFQSPKIMTRSQYRKALERDEAKVLNSSRYKLGNTIKMSPEEEEQLLEDLILSKRHGTAPQGSSAAGSWDTGAEGMGSEGPQCVVCQLAPRTVLVWPCGCLSLCDDCRVGLASKNYTACVCCRTNVVAYSRLYVP